MSFNLKLIYSNYLLCIHSRFIIEFKNFPLTYESLPNCPDFTHAHGKT